MQKERNNKKKKTVKTGSPGTTKAKVNQESVPTSTNSNDNSNNQANKSESELQIESNKQAKELFNQLKDKAEQLKLEIKAKLEAKDTNKENEDESTRAAAADASRVKEILEKAILEDETVKSTQKSPVVAPINVTLDESQEKESTVEEPETTADSCDPPLNELPRSGDSSVENSTQKAVEEATTIHQEDKSSSIQPSTASGQVEPTTEQLNSSATEVTNASATTTSAKAALPIVSAAAPSSSSPRRGNSNESASFSDRKQRPLTSKLTSEQAMKSVASCSSDQEKIQLMAKKLSETTDQVRSLEIQMRSQEKMIAQLIKEREALQGEHNRTLLVRSRLENVCRELQRQNRAVKEEALAKIKEEEEKRREVASKFQGTLNEVLHLVQENQGRNDQLKAENVDLAGKLKALMSHYELWEASVQKLIQQKELECKLLAAKMAHSNALADQEREHSLSEKEILFAKIAELQEKGMLMSATEAHLKEELAAYTAKYDEFQKILGKSNETFGQFKKDMDKMSKQMKKMEKETFNWKSKFDSCNKDLIQVSLEKQAREKELIQALSKIETLQKLCRALQARNSVQTNQTNEEGGGEEVCAVESQNQSVTCSNSQS